MIRYKFSLWVLLCCLFIGLQISPAKAASTFYVATNGSDNNAGTIDRPWKTLQKAAREAQAGDRVLVRGGTYYSDSVNFGNFGSANAPIVFQAYPGEKAILDGSQSYNSLLVFWGQYYELRDFEIRNSKRTAVSLIGGRYIRIDNNTIHNSVRGAIYADSTAGNMTIANNRIYHNVRMNDRFQFGHWGGWPAAVVLSPSSDVVINNEIYENWGEGIGVYGRNHYIANNILHDNYSVEIYVNNTENTTIERNFLYSEDLSAFHRDFGPVTGPAVGMTIANENWGIAVNNIKILNNITGRRAWGISQWRGSAGMASGLQNVTIANNTVIVEGLNGVFHLDENNHSNTLVANNIFYQLRGDKPITFFRKSSGVNFKNNNWHGGNGWKAAGGDGKMSSDVNGDPRVANPRGRSAHEFALNSNSPLINRGAAVSGVNTDYFGITRSSSPDIGAAERSGSTSSQPTPTPQIPLPTPVPASSAAPTLVSPANEARLTNPDWQVIQWQQVPNVQNYDIIIERDNGSRVSLIDAICTGSMCYKNVAAAWAVPNNTRLRWYIVAIDGQGRRSASSTRWFTTAFGVTPSEDVVSSSGPTLMSPNNEFTLPDPDKLVFQWQRLSSTTQYDIILQNSGGSEVFRHRATCTGDMCYRNPSSDPSWNPANNTRYMWMVVAVLDNGSRLNSERRWITTQYVPTTIRAYEPVVSAMSEPASATVTQTITFSWDYDERVEDYRLTLITPDGTRTHSDWSPAALMCINFLCSQQLSVETQGTHQWFVSGRNGAETVRIPKRKLELNGGAYQMPAPVLVENAPVVNNVQDLRLRWNRLEGVNRYTVVIADAIGMPLFSADVSCKNDPCGLRPAKNTAFNIPAQGQYQWYVIAHHQNGARVSSLPAVMTTDLMPAALLLSTPGESVPRGKVAFSWLHDPRVQHYRLTVFNAKTGRVFNKWINAADICVDLLCTKNITLNTRGEYRWSVRAKTDHISTIVKSANTTFRVTR